MDDALTATGRWQGHLRGFRFLVDGTGTALAAGALLVALAVCAALVVTWPLVPRLLRAVGALAEFERRRTGRHLGHPPSAHGTLPAPAVRRDLGWLVLHATAGTLAGVAALSAPIGLVQNLALAAAWPLFPGTVSTLNTPVASWGQAGLTVLIAAGYAAAGVLVVPPLAHGYLRLNAARLAPPPAALARRLAQVTATRAAAVDAHAVELRRIERDLHDGVQNRVVAVAMHLGIAERALERDPAAALPVVLAARTAAEEALADLRDVVRSIYPPALADRGLAGSVAGLAAHSPVPCSVREEPLPPVAAAVAAAAYFTVAEALTNTAKHGRATRVRVDLRADAGRLVVEVHDDGAGGADERAGTGLDGVRRRVEALDGTMSLHSPPGGPTTVRVTLPAQA
ncbi:histidine kinase [Kineococcus sp. TRM81007]|uniref:sensor histidine kinase n=1 Tax=Kineococcus sp. TRM81007 TaxID=2925831 RepID=UPI001F58F21E|nr:histidine kinase [Kineococcus sp. TRM81007]MCI2237164.1 histidine kinase [Kineococcus sp. TRM81007]